MTSFTAETTTNSRRKFATEMGAAFAEGGALEDRDHFWDELEQFLLTGDRCANRDDHTGAFLAFGGGWARLQELLAEAAEQEALAARAQDALDAEGNEDEADRF